MPLPYLSLSKDFPSILKYQWPLYSTIFQLLSIPLTSQCITPLLILTIWAFFLISEYARLFPTSGLCTCSSFCQEHFSLQLSRHWLFPVIQVSAKMSPPQRGDHPFYQSCSPSTQSCMSLLFIILSWSIFSMAPPTPWTYLVHVSFHFLIISFPPVENPKPCHPISHFFSGTWNNAGHVGGAWQPAKFSTGFYTSFR